MTRIVLLLIVCCIGSTLFAQKPVGSLKGKVFDKQNKLVLPSTTASLLNTIDSSMIGFTVSNKEGLFELKNIPAGVYLLNLTFTGYLDLYRTIRVSPDKPLLELGDIFMEPDTSMLAAVVGARSTDTDQRMIQQSSGPALSKQGPMLQWRIC